MAEKFSRPGHAERLEREHSFQRQDIQLYNDKCGPPPLAPASTPASCPEGSGTKDAATKAAAATAGLGALYWIVSEGSRLFPPRNLFPLP
jgi:hypothetical protein